MIHLAKIENLQPENHRIIGLAYMQQVDEYDYELEIEFYDDTPVDEAVVGDISHNVMYKKSFCNHCGKRIRYVLIGIDVNGVINTFGSECADGITKLRGYNLENSKKLNLAKIKRIDNKRKVNEFLALHTGLEAALNCNNKIVQSIRENLVKYFSLSEKQIELVFKMVEKQASFDVINQQREAGAENITEGRVMKSKFKVVSIKPQYDECGNLEVYKITVENEKGWRAYGNLPGVLTETPVVVGEEITASATMTASKHNAKFGFFKRMTIY